MSCFIDTKIMPVKHRHKHKYTILSHINHNMLSVFEWQVNINCIKVIAGVMLQ